MSKKKKYKFDWDLYTTDSYEVDTAEEDMLPQPESEDSTEDWGYNPQPVDKYSVTTTVGSDDEYDDDPIEWARPISMEDIFGDSLDEPDESENISVTEAKDDAWGNFQVPTEWNSKEGVDVDEDEDEDDFTLQCQRPLSLKDLGLEEVEIEETDKGHADTLMTGYVRKIEPKLLEATNRTSKEEAALEPPSVVTERTAMIAPQTSPVREQISSHTAAQQRKDKSPKLNLQDFENALTSKLILLYHNETLHYYNGRTYVGINTPSELLALVRTEISYTAFASTSTKPFGELLTYLKASPHLVPIDYKKQLLRSKYMVVFKNGILDVKTMEFLSHSPRHLTFHEFDAEFTDRKPRAFLRFVHQSAGGDPEIVQRMIESIGYILSGLNDGKCFFVMGLAPNSGKSTLGQLLLNIIGDNQVTSISPQQLDGRFSLGGTQNCILCQCLDIPRGRLSPGAVSIIKGISGGDKIRSEVKYVQPVDIVSKMRFLFGTNHPISVSEVDSEDAFWDRMIVIPFMFSIPPKQVDHNLLEKLLAEKDAIISYCLSAVSDVINNNMIFSPCSAADQMKSEWRNAAIDPRSFEEFWYSQIAVTGDFENSVFAMEMYDRYKAFCGENQYEPIPYLNMRNWIAANISTDDCIPKRIHRTNENPKAGYCGIYFTEKK